MKTNCKPGTVPVRIPREMWRRLKIEAAKSDRSLSSVLAERLGKHISSTGKGGEPAQ